MVLSTELSQDTKETNIVAKLKNVNMGDFLPFAFTKPEMQGLLTGTATVRDPFGKFGIDFKGTADSFSLDHRYVGKVNLDATANTQTGEVTVNDISANEGDFVFKLKGRINYKDSTGNDMGTNAYAGRLNLNILEPYLGSIFSKMDGIAHSDLKVFSEGGHKYITGQATIDSGSVKVAYTQCKYLLNNETVTFRKDEIDLGTMKLKDTLNNEGIVAGKMYHNFFQDFSFDNIRFETGKMLLLNTSKKDNSQFYGNVIGLAKMNLNGPVTNMVMNISGQPSFLDSSHISVQQAAVKKAIQLIT